MLTLALIALVSGGTIYPKTSTPILLSYNNAGSISDYTFSYQISSYIPSTSILEITFPSSVYSNGLNMNNCTAKNWNGIQLQCTVTGTTVAVSVGELSNADTNNTYTLTIQNVLNPSIGGSGMFKFQIRTGINIIDYSDFFGDVGIVASLNTISSAIVSCTSNCIAGQVSSYFISFQTAVAYETGSRIFIQFPSSLTLPYPVQCTSAKLPGISCSSSSNLISVSGTTSVISSLTVLDFTFSGVTNPGVSGNVGKFSVYSFVPVVNTVIDQQLNIPGPVITPSTITSIVACPGGPNSICIGYYPYVSLSNTQPYTLTITTTNPVPRGGTLFIKFVAGFVLNPSYCIITNGLKNQGYTENDQILCTVNSTISTLTITKFATFNGGIFSLSIIATNPSTAGTYSSFKVTTYADLLMTQIIDTGMSGYITVVNIPPPSKWQVAWNKPLIVNSVVQSTITFQPFTNNLQSSSVSFKLYFPSSFAFSGTVLGYLTPHDVFPELQVTPTIQGTYMQIPSSTFSQPYTNSLNADNQIRIAGASTTSGIILPSMPGNYFIQMVTAQNSIDIEATLYKMVVLPDVMAGSVQAYSYDVLKNSLYELQFTPTITIPQGTVPELPQNSWGTFDIWFPTMNTNLQPLWLPDLGTGGQSLDIIPCKAILNIAPVNGDNLICRLITASSVSPNTYATVRVTNFQIIYLNVPVTIHIANIQNPVTPGITAFVTVATYQITQRIYQELNQVNFTYPIYFYLNTDPTLPKINGRSPAPYGDGLNQFVFLPNTVNLYSLLTFILWTESDIQAGGNFYLKFPSAYPLTEDSILCYIDYATQLPCYTYPDSGWISILNLQYIMNNHVEYTFTIRYLKNPSHRQPPEAPSIVAISSDVEIEYIYFDTFAYLDPGAISPVNVYPSSYKALAVDTTYYWIFTPTNSLATGSEIILTFPKGDYVLDTSPAPSCSVSGLSTIDSLTPIYCNISGTSIIIYNFANYTGGNKITVTIYSILNPSTARITGYFTIETYDQTSSLVDSNYIIPQITIQAQLSVGLFQYIDFYANPNNGYAIADYTISILPSITIPAGSIIKIIFPQDEYSGFSATQTCSISGGLSTLNSCYSDLSNTIYVVTDSDYTKTSLSPPINITIYGITNFAPLITSGLLEVGISNSGVIINSSPSSEKNRKITTGGVPGVMKLINLSIDPVTAGERATYNFTFGASLSFSSDCSIVIKFPSFFSRDLSEFVHCYSEEISLNLDYSVASTVKGLVLTVYNTMGWTGSSTNNFTISVMHVRNPNSMESGNFIYYSTCGYNMQDYGTQTFSKNFQQLPSAMYLISAHSNGDTTLYPQETVTMISYSPLGFAAASQDQIIVDFPIDYNLMFVASLITCSAEIGNTGFSSLCTYEPNRLRLDAFTSNPITAGIKNYGAQLNNIENPAAQQPARYISVSLYQSSTKEFYSKTYSNLNRVGTFSYISQGIQVIINSLKTFSINIGTSIDSISANIPSGAQTSFSIYGYISEPNCLITPNPITFNVRDFYQYFSVSCNSSAIVGSHWITWLFQGTWPPNYWSPIQRTYFTVIGTNSDTISVSSIGAISLGGQSLPIPITLSHSPESSLTISILKVGTLPTNITISPSNVTFTKGVTSLTFTISINVNSIGTSGRVLLQKSGTDSQYFTLVQSILFYDVGPKDTVPPIIVEYKVLSVNLITASFSVTVNKPCNVYWMVGRYGTKPGSLSEVIAGKLNNMTGLHDNPIFGVDFSYQMLASNRYQYTLNIGGLLAQTNYTIYIYAVNIGGSLATFIPTISFNTLDRYLIATFPVYTNQTLTSDQINSTLLIIANTLGINSTLVIQRTDYSGSTGTPVKSLPYETNNYISSSGISRLLQTVYKLDVLVLPDPSQNIRPLDLINSLQNYETSLGAIYGFNSSYTITGQEVYGATPYFKSTPKLGSVIAGVLTIINLSLFENGYISICVILYNSTDYIPPIPYQINNLLGPHNYPCNMGQIIKASSVPTQAFFNNIQAGTSYKVFICAYNSIQAYPNYMTTYATISFSTYGMSSSKTSYEIYILVSFGIILLL